MEILRIVVESGANNLQKLILKNNRIKDEDIQCIADFVRKKNISLIDLGSNCITNQGARMIASSQCMRDVSHLILSDNQIDHIGIQTISKSEQLRKLTCLKRTKKHGFYMYCKDLNSQEQKACIEEIRKSLPKNCQIIIGGSALSS